MTSFKNMGMGQRIATVALLLLALICAIAFAGRNTGGSGGSGQIPQASGFIPSTYVSSSGSDSGGDSSSGSSSAASDSSRTPDSGLAQVALSDLPAQAQETVRLIDAGGPYPYSRDGIVYGNYNGILPKKARGWYHEYTVKTPGASNRGARRIIAGKDGTLFYTADHYASFEQVTR